MENAHFLIALVLALGLPYFGKVIPRVERTTIVPQHWISSPGWLVLFIFYFIWLSLVNDLVPEPYLDEVFHIPQAQKYLEGRWSEWDDKITTPPGLYLISAVTIKAREWVYTLTQGRLSSLQEYSIGNLRKTNLPAIVVVAGSAAQCRLLLEARNRSGLEHVVRSGSPRAAPTATKLSFYSMHAALNIALFPIIFFFSGLYYTDPWSTAIVLLAYNNHLERTVLRETSIQSLFSDVMTITIGVLALFMRQTNVFWVVVYFGGLEAINALKACSRDEGVVEPPKFTDAGSAAKFYLSSYASGRIHDPSLNTADFYDIIWLVISVVVAAVFNLPRVLRQIWPYITVLFLFAGFVLWNEGVALGDKSNHVATLHLAQMLYIWPLFAFFSVPLMLRDIVSVVEYTENLRSGRQQGKSEKKAQGQPSSRGEECSKKVQSEAQKDWFLGALQLLSSHNGSHHLFPLWYLSIPIAAAIVHFNTIVHPFTLADNRHYMFYVFRYTILRHPAVRYLLVPAYVLCHRLCWQLLCGIPFPKSPTSSGGPASQHQWLNAPYRGITESPSPPRKEGAENTRPQQAAPGQSQPDNTLSTLNTTFPSSAPLSTALLWLLATSLSLVTAPLVEPRYFILPWVMWRILLPAWTVDDCGIGEGCEPKNGNGNGNTTRSITSRLVTTLRSLGGDRIDLRLVVETLWFVAINAATMYIFLTRPYHWTDVDGKPMDGGRLQRFMW